MARQDFLNLFNQEIRICNLRSLSYQEIKISVTRVLKNFSCPFQELMNPENRKVCAEKSNTGANSGRSTWAQRISRLHSARIPPVAAESRKVPPIAFLWFTPSALCLAQVSCLPKCSCGFSLHTPFSHTYVSLPNYKFSPRDW